MYASINNRYLVKTRGAQLTMPPHKRNEQQHWMNTMCMGYYETEKLYNSQKVDATVHSTHTHTALPVQFSLVPTEALTFVIVSVWLALAVPFVLPTTLVHSKLLDCFEPSVTSSALCCCERFHKMRTTQYDSRIKIVNKIPKNIGDSCIAPLSTAETTTTNTKNKFRLR